MIKTEELQNRAEIPIKGEPAAVAAIHAMKARKAEPEPDAVADRLAALEARIAAARELRPPRSIEDGRCWGMGRDAVLAVIDGA